VLVKGEANRTFPFIFLQKVAVFCKIKCRELQNPYAVICNGALYGGAMITFFGFAKTVEAGAWLKKSWLQRIHVKPLMDRSHICIFIQNFDKDILQHSVFFSCKKTVARDHFS
jgi:hypothetical protein